MGIYTKLTVLQTLLQTIGFISRAQGHNALKPVVIAIAAVIAATTGSAADTGLGSRPQAMGNRWQAAGNSQWVMAVGGHYWFCC